MTDLTLRLIFNEPIAEDQILRINQINKNVRVLVMNRRQGGNKRRVVQDVF